MKDRHLIIEQSDCNSISQNRQYHQHVKIKHPIKEWMLSRQEIYPTTNSYIAPIPMGGVDQHTHQYQYEQNEIGLNQ